MQAEPDIFAISLYLWNVQLALSVAQWVKHQWPRCLVISGGPHQHFKYDMEWFKKHPYLDASLPGDCYGELFIAEVLDHYQDGVVDWHQCTETRFPSPQRNCIQTSNKTLGRAEKRQFDYQWTSFAKQQRHIHEYMDFAPDAKFMAILETTRGCPYGCTYCDWGGGISTAVIKKNIEIVLQDIEFLCQLNLQFLYIADANFGIFGDRDVTIIEYLAAERANNRRLFSIGYGGFAKTPGRLDTLQQIIKIGIENKMNYGNLVKLSLQSLDTEVLTAINRQNIDLAKQLNSYRTLSCWSDDSALIECILGLPMMTLDKFYRELDEIGRLGLKSVLWYEWHILPETPAYSPEYLSRYGLKTVKRTRGWEYNQVDSEIDIVIASNTYSANDFIIMLLSTSAWRVFRQGGLFAKSIQWVMDNKKIGWGELIRSWSQHTLDHEKIFDEWQAIQADTSRPCLFDIQGHKVFGGSYLLGQLCYEKKTQQSLADWLCQKHGCPKDILVADLKQHLEELDYESLNRKLRLYQQPSALLRKKSTLWQRLLQVW